VHLRYQPAGHVVNGGREFLLSRRIDQILGSVEYVVAAVEEQIQGRMFAKWTNASLARVGR
jgi:hypothetical protein